MKFDITLESTVECSTCDENENTVQFFFTADLLDLEDALNEQDITPEAVERQLTNFDWVRTKSGWMCPDCSTKGR